MATFDESELTDLAEIFGVESVIMADHLVLRAHSITDSDKTSILARITAYKLIETDNVEITAGPAGFHGSISPSAKRSLIKNKIAALIGWEVSAGASLVRG